MVMRLVLCAWLLWLDHANSLALPSGRSSRSGAAGTINQDAATRRQALSVAASLLLLPTAARADTGAEVRGIDVTPFNGLMFQYRGADNLDTVVRASELNEPSISYADFISKLQAGDVEFVEFLAPDGDVAYATLKGESAIRIGEGYPKEQHDGWSSPAFAVRAVKNAGVPYKFTVPALASFRKS